MRISPIRTCSATHSSKQSGNMNFAPIELLKELPDFPVLAFPFKSQQRAMIEQDGRTLFFEHGQELEPMRNDMPYDAYGRLDEDQRFQVDDLEFVGNVNNRANMLMGLDTELDRALLVHVHDSDGLEFLLKSVKANGYLGLIIRPFDARFGDREYEMTSSLFPKPSALYGSSTAT